MISNQINRALKGGILIQSERDLIAEGVGDGYTNLERYLAALVL